MAWYDRIIGRRPQRKLSPLEQWQQTLDTNLIKDARTPVMMMNASGWRTCWLTPPMAAQT